LEREGNLAQLRIPLIVLFLHLICGPPFTLLAEAQEGSNTVFLPNQQVVVPTLPPLVATSTDRSAGMAAALEIVIHDKAVCCGKDSALEDAALYASLSASVSLKELSAKIQGRHLLSDGRPIQVNAEYLVHSSVNGGWIVNTLREQRALLLEWGDRVYVVYGAIFDIARDTGSGVEAFAVHKLLLLDPRFSDRKRVTEFNRDSDDWEKVRGITVVKVLPQ
jgi:hypothetical protein